MSADSTPSAPDYSLLLRSRMAAANLPSYRALARAAAVSEGAIRRLRQGQIGRLPLTTLRAISQALGLSLATLLAEFDAATAGAPTGEAVATVAALRQEYQRLQQQLQQQRQSLWAEFQQDTLRRLEPWLLQWPTATHAVRQNPDLPAARLVPLGQPWERLLADWGISPIAAVGAEIPFDPHRHELMGGTAQPGEAVRVRYVGYCQGERLLYRAKVSPVGAG